MPAMAFVWGSAGPCTRRYCCVQCTDSAFYSSRCAGSGGRHAWWQDAASIPAEDVTWQAAVKWRGVKADVLVVRVKCDAAATWHASSRESQWTWDTVASSRRYPRQLLQSNLQKAVRLGAVPAACASATQLLVQGDAATLLRRLPIIAVEDAWPLPCAATLTWLMCALAKGMVLTAEDRSFVLGATAQLAQCRDSWRAIIPQSMPEHDSATIPGTDTAKTLLWRQAFGGMKGDMAMLRRCAWWANSAADILPPSWCAVEPKGAKDQRLQLRAPSQFRVGATTLLSAVDMHCSSVLACVAAAHPHVTDADASDAIWHNSSKTNFRVKDPPPPDTVAVWQAISDVVRRFQRDAWKQPPGKRLYGSGAGAGAGAGEPRAAAGAGAGAGGRTSKASGAGVVSKRRARPIPGQQRLEMFGIGSKGDCK